MTEDTTKKAGGKSVPKKRPFVQSRKFASLLEGVPVVKIDIKKLVPDPENPKRHPEKNRKAIEDSVKEFGQVENIVVQKRTGIIIAGNERVSVMKKLGYKHVACVMLDVDDPTRKRLAVALNRSGELGVWNDEVLANILKDTKELPGFSERDIDTIMETVKLESNIKSGGDDKFDSLFEEEKIEQLAKNYVDADEEDESEDDEETEDKPKLKKGQKCPTCGKVFTPEKSDSQKSRKKVVLSSKEK